jgi:non-heme chloroperoxidase
MSTGRSRFANNDGVAIHYVDATPPVCRSDVPVLFVPGMTDVAADYATMAELLGRRTLVVELRGHGHSDAPRDGYRFDDHVADIAAVAEDAGVSEVHVMTFSRGTCYALGWVAGNRWRVRSLSIGDYPAREIAIPPPVADRLLAGTWRGTPVLDRIDARAARRMFDAAQHRPLWHVLGGLAAPTLVVRSGAGVPVTDDDWALYGAVAHNVERHHFEDSPHDIFRPDRTRYPHLVADLCDRAELAHA